jgi:hypothetical protein
MLVNPNYQQLHQQQQRQPGTCLLFPQSLRITYKPRLTAPPLPTAGLISPAPSRKHTQLQTASKQVEAMVLSKMAQREVRPPAVCSWGRLVTGHSQQTPTKTNTADQTPTLPKR